MNEGNGEFSYFKRPITNALPVMATDLEVLHSIIVSTQFLTETNYIRTLTRKQADEYKPISFDYITPHGTFSYRDDDCVTALSGLFVADIDKQSNIELIAERLCADKILLPRLIFRSPSGKGLKVFYAIDTKHVNLSGKTRMRKVWDAVNLHLSQNYSDIITPVKKKKFGLCYIDSSGSDLSRACFVCHDPRAFYNPAAEVFHFTEIPTQVAPTERTRKANPGTSLQDLAGRHLTEPIGTEELLSFFHAANVLHFSKQSVLQYLDTYATINPDSTKADREKLLTLIEDAQTRYYQQDEDLIRLTELSFSKDIFLFRYVREVGRFVISSLYLNGVRKLLHDGGFRKKYTTTNVSIFIRQVGSVIEEVGHEQMRDYVNKYVDQFDQDLAFTYLGENYQVPCDTLREIYLRNADQIFNDKSLRNLYIHDTPTLKDTRTQTYFFFQNGLVTVTANDLTLTPWDEVEKFCVWKEQLIPRNFKYVPDNLDCKFAKFFQNINATNVDRIEAMATAVGYLLNYSFLPSEGQVITLYDQTITDIRRPEGGSGKGLVANAIKEMRHVSKIDGRHFSGESRFRWELVTPSVQVVWIDDTKPDFPFESLFSNLTDGWTIERKFLPQFQIPPQDSPKVLIASNTILKGEGTSYTRRKFEFELSDYYSRKLAAGDDKPIETEHGGTFFTPDWPEEEWNQFYSFMCDCAQAYLLAGKVIRQKSINVEMNRLRQSTDEAFVEWVQAQEWNVNLEYEPKVLFEEFRIQYYGEDSKHTQRTFSNWIKIYGRYRGWIYEHSHSSKVSKFIFKPV